MGNPYHPKILIFDLEGLRGVESKKFFWQKLKNQAISETSNSKTYPFEDPNPRNVDQKF